MDWQQLINIISNNPVNSETNDLETDSHYPKSDQLKFKQVKRVWDEAANYRFTQNFDKDLEFNHIKHLVKKQAAVKLRLKSFIKYAAVFILGFFSTYGLFELSFSKDEGIDNEVFAPYGQTSEITLVDGTTIILNSGSRLRYPSRFSFEEREVHLDGEAFFKVKSDKNNPFIVKTHMQEVKVLGTQFNVKAYSEDTNVSTTLVEGVVSIYNSYGVELIQLRPKEKAIFDKVDRKLEVVDADIELDIGWKDGIYFFKEITLEELAKRLNRWYGTRVIIKEDDLKKEIYTGKFYKDQTIWDALKLIEYTIPIDYTTGNREIIISKKP